MKLETLCSNILILFYLAHGINGDERIPQIKVVGTDVKRINPIYVRNIVVTIRRANETYNYFNMYWDIKRDLPADVAMYLKLFVTDSTYQGGTLILQNATPICKPSKDHEILPSILQVPKSAFNTKCLKKGVYQGDNTLGYRYEVLVPNIGNLGNYFRAEFRLGTHVQTFSAIDFYHEWGYLHAE